MGGRSLRCRRMPDSPKRNRRERSWRVGGRWRRTRHCCSKPHLWTTARCSSYPVLPIATAVGHGRRVRGPAASAGTGVREVKIEEVQDELRRQGANLGGDE